jgi:hypothetical protein
LLYVRNVTADDLYNSDIPRIDLTSETLTWEPTTTLYEEQKKGMLDYSGDIVRDAAVRGPSLVINALHPLVTDTADRDQPRGLLTNAYSTSVSQGSNFVT